MTTAAPPARPREHAGDRRAGIAGDRPLFLLLLLQVGVVGLALGVGRVVVPLLGREVFGLERSTAVLSFIAAFGLAKAPLNLVAGTLVARIGGRRVLILGWLVALPVPVLIAWAPSFAWVVAAYVLLGAQQGLCWSATIMMKVDLVGEDARGLAIGWNECVGYLGTAIAAFGGALLASRYGLRTMPFVALGLLILLAIALAAATPERPHPVTKPAAARSGGPVVPHFASIAQAGLVTKLADVAAWGILPIHLRNRGLSVATVGILAAAYPLAWAVLQPVSGWFSDRVGRAGPVVAGLAAQAVGFLVLAAASARGGWFLGAVILGAGTALVYPVLLAAAGDAAEAGRRSASIGRYRFWRDLGFVVGGVGAGPVADSIGFPAALAALAVVALASALWFSLGAGHPTAARGSARR